MANPTFWTSAALGYLNQLFWKQKIDSIVASIQPTPQQNPQFLNGIQSSSQAFSQMQSSIPVTSPAPLSASTQITQSNSSQTISLISKQGAKSRAFIASLPPPLLSRSESPAPAQEMNEEDGNLQRLEQKRQRHEEQLHVIEEDLRRLKMQLPVLQELRSNLRNAPSSDEILKSLQNTQSTIESSLESSHVPDSLRTTAHRALQDLVETISWIIVNGTLRSKTSTALPKPVSSLDATIGSSVHSPKTGIPSPLSDKLMPIAEVSRYLTREKTSAETVRFPTASQFQVPLGGNLSPTGSLSTSPSDPFSTREATSGSDASSEGESSESSSARHSKRKRTFQY